MKRYVYEGPVMEFEKCVADHWRGETVAVSERKARCNLSYQYKKENDRVANIKITLPGKIKAID